ncbi:MAG: TetR/AcrR family transcriptional regulator, partial [Bacillota bacterium]|nr:TetR/AcrR family transcriptional regulator [Bacillota bacterium]
GYKVFATYPYKKASMLAISEEAGISKSLLFYYFRNKEEYYLYLFDTAIKFLNAHKLEPSEGKVYDFFDLVNMSVERRMKVMDEYPYLFEFSVRAYYETNEEIRTKVNEKKRIMISAGEEEILDIIDYNRFKNPSDAAVLLKIVFSMAEGIMRGREDLNTTKMLEGITEFKAMMESLKKYYYKD